MAAVTDEAIGYAYPEIDFGTDDVPDLEELMAQLKENYTIIIVTHNMQQAARASDRTVFMNMADDRAGYVVEQDQTVTIFTNPSNQMTEDYVSGRFG